MHSWKEIERLYFEALGRAPEEREGFLQTACKGNETLFEEVSSLLNTLPEVGDFLEKPALNEATERVSESQAARSSVPQPGSSQVAGLVERSGKGDATEAHHLRLERTGMLKTLQRDQWWMVIVTGWYFATFVLIFWLVIWGPAQLKGIVATFEDGAMVIRSLAVDSEAAKGVLAAGDRVLSIDGRPMRGPGDWTAATGNWEAGRPHRWLVSRGADRVSLEVVPFHPTVRGRLAEGYDRYLIHLLSGFLLGLLVAWKRPADPVARCGAWFLMTASLAFGLAQGWAAPWRELPTAAQLALWIPQISRFVLEGILLSFLVVFPRRLFTARWPWFVIWVPVLATLPWRIAAFDAVIRPGQGASVPTWILQAGFARTIVYLFAAVVILVVSYRRLPDLNSRRRVRVLNGDSRERDIHNSDGLVGQFPPHPLARGPWRELLPCSLAYSRASEQCLLFQFGLSDSASPRPAPVPSIPKPIGFT